ncbi:hypothetical protein [Cypionkella sp.]|uniref:hypothetical protein n=1 Tax=Cypionkella sp. TaxID=2811411 RepID=UPI0027258D56|nr:hypothetical protein [Cypionkella sp.]MDO8982996.1 hypothetical protein [Cypionkella sp.]
MRTDAIYGSLPVDLGLVDISPVEQMAWLYCPIKLPSQLVVTMPPNLWQFMPIINAVIDDVVDTDADLWPDSYVYLTAKRLWVTADSPGNRPGWHSDGFLTDDLNYIWSDGNPTVFWSRETQKVSFIADHVGSIPEMELICETDRFRHHIYSNKHLLRLDQTVMHRVGPVANPGFRSFVKVSVAKDLYALEGNSINHGLPIGGRYQARAEVRNNPAGRSDAL